MCLRHFIVELFDIKLVLDFYNFFNILLWFYACHVYILSSVLLECSTGTEKCKYWMTNVILKINFVW